MLHRCRTSLSIAIAALLCVFVAAAVAQDLDPPQVKGQLADWSRLVDRAGREAATLRLTEADVQRLTEQATSIKEGAAGLKETVNGQAGETRELLESMGTPAPGAAEAEDAAAQRKQLQEKLAQFEGWERQAELIIARADQLIDRVAAKRLELFAQTLLKRLPSPLNPLTWAVAARELGGLADVIGTSLGTWGRRLLESDSGVGSAMLLVLAAVIAGFAVGLAARRELRRRGGDPSAVPQPLSRMRGAGLAFVAALSPAAFAVLGAWAAWPERELLPNAVVMAVVAGLAMGTAVLLLCRWGIAAALAPARPERRAVPIGDAEAATLARRLGRVAWLLAVQIAVDRATSALMVVDNFNAAWNFAMAITFAVAVIRVLERRLWTWSLPAAAPVAADEAVPVAARGDLTWQALRYLALAALWSAPLLAAIGYANLAEYMYVGVVETGLVLIAAAAGKLLVRAVVEAAFDPEHPLGRRIGAAFTVDTQGLRLAQFWIGLSADFLIIAAAAVAMLVVWGAGRDDIVVLGSRLVEGVRIGSVTISVTDVLLAMLVFTVALGATRYVQRILDQRIFPGTQLDMGVRNSLRTSVGYVGLVIAGGLAISTVGLNLSSLAIVAGALSVGIGFGLQNIVNNFVSGLILLVERPIKTGDWIVAGGHSGIVKRINVRSTEIETASRSTVLIPNSEFLSNAVVNWTHKDVSGRIEILVNVAHVTDAALVRDVLLQCAASHPGVMKKPAPNVLLKDFNAVNFQYELQVCVPQAVTMAGVASELRFAIDKAFRARGIGRPPATA